MNAASASDEEPGEPGAIEAADTALRTEIARFDEHVDQVFKHASDFLDEHVSAGPAQEFGREAVEIRRLLALLAGRQAVYGLFVASGIENFGSALTRQLARRNGELTLAREAQPATMATSMASTPSTRRDGQRAYVAWPHRPDRRAVRVLAA